VDLIHVRESQKIKWKRLCWLISLGSRWRVKLGSLIT